MFLSRKQQQCAIIENNDNDKSSLPLPMVDEEEKIIIKSRDDDKNMLKKSWTQNDLLDNSRKFNLDLTPKVFIWN